MPWWIVVGAAVALIGTTLSRTSPTKPKSGQAEPFEAPKYIASLIAAINDGAKTAQTGVLAFSAVGLYLLATAFSTTDEDLLLQHTSSIAQLGVQVPVVFSFAVAPLVFVALHVFTLVRYAMLAINLRQFRADLDAMVPLEADRERCRQLLTNVEFVVSRAVPRESPLQSRIFPVIAFGLIAVFPVAVLVVLQVSALRYQSEGVNWAQRSALVIDLGMLMWFYRRQQLAGVEVPRFGLRWLRLWIGLVLIPAILVAANIVWLGIPGLKPSTRVLNNRFAPLGWYDLGRPLDKLCRSDLRWGCRFLTVDNRTLVGRVWKEEAIATLHAGEGNVKAALAAIEGSVLRLRTLRFANFDNSRLFGVDLVGADLSDASLLSANLIGADLQAAHLNGAGLRNANLSLANLLWADLSGAYLNAARLRGAYLHQAHLSNADLSDADLRGAILFGAFLSNANLIRANLSGADLRAAQLSGANLLDANLSGAYLTADPDPGALPQRDIVSQSQLDEACGDEKTQLPPGLTIKPCPPGQHPAPNWECSAGQPISMFFFRACSRYASQM